MPTRILITDDHEVVRAGLAAILSTERGVEIVGEASTADEALLLAEKLKPDLILMDISMPGMGGIEATRRIMKQNYGCRVLILTVHEDESMAREAIHAGAAGYIPKRALKTELIGAIQIVLRGDLYIHPAMMRSMLAEPSPPAAEIKPAIELLTAREKEILRFIALGYTNNQIAQMVHLSARTVEYHRANLMDKLNLTSRVDLVRYAAEQGII